jgi:hypothetical protein
MKPHERAQLLVLMEANARAFQDAAKGIAPHLAAQRPDPQRWSVLECAEHVAMVEAGLFARVTAAEHSDTPRIDEKREFGILRYAAERNNKVEAPEAVKPTGRFSTVDQALGEFLANREKTIRFINDCELDLRAQLTTHPRFGEMNSYELLLLMAMHPARHAAQIREIGDALAFAKTSNPA